MRKYLNILVNEQLDAQFFFSYMFIPNLYMFRALTCTSIRRVNCINTTFGVCHSNSPDDEHVSARNM
jgi:hypothetical protein